MGRLFGLETEYGIQVDDVAHMDVVVESMELVRCYLREDFVARWDYGRENPRRDARGFEVSELRNDKDETSHLQRDRQRQIPLRELKSDLLLSNGARFYNDHTHPEYATPECRTLADLVEHDRAGERILLDCARRRTATRGSGVVRLYKNNTDFEGHSYGCHENYLIGRELAFQQVIDGLAKARLPGRMEIVHDDPRILVDGAHNAASMEALMRAIGQNIPYDSMVVIFGCRADKDIRGMLRHIQLGADKVIFTDGGAPRPADPSELAVEYTERCGKMAQVAPTLDEALDIAERAVTREDIVCIAGSFYLVGKAKRLVKQRYQEAEPVLSR